MTGPGVGGRPRRARGRARGLARLVAVAVAVRAAAGSRRAVPVVAGSAGRADGYLLVQHAQRGLHVRVGDGQLPEPDELLEPAVDDAALVHGRAAVAEAVGDRRVRVAGLGQPDEV